MTDHPIQGMLETAMQKIKDMMDVNTVIGTPMEVGDGVVIIPISKISLGFASGGSNFPSKQPKDMFGGGSGGGVSVVPVGFLVVRNGDVKLLQLYDNASTADKIVGAAPDFIDKIASVFKKDKNNSKESE